MGNEHHSLVDGMYLSPDNLSPAWKAVHLDLLSKGFTVAAYHMAQMVRMIKPNDYWARAKS